MEVTAFIIELSAEVVKGIQGGNEYRTMINGAQVTLEVGKKEVKLTFNTHKE
jgi:hypothetical protein